MLFVAVLLAALTGSAVAQEACGCSVCTVDSCYDALAGTSAFPIPATINDCRSFLWTSVTVGAVTVTATGVPPTTGAGGPTDIPSPERVVPAYAAACPDPAAYSSACDCIGVTKLGTTYIHLPTATVWEAPAATPDISCGNAGLQVAIYDNPYLTFDAAYGNFVPEHFKTATPYDTKSTSSLGLRAADIAAPHGFTPQTASVYTLNYRGYFYASKTSTYTFTATDADDIAIFWTAGTAVSGWQRSNERGESYWRNPGDTPITGTYSVALTAGQYLPLRLMHANRGGGGKYTFGISDADGNVYVQYGTPSPYLVSSACAVGQAPAYPDPFGAET
ncbi:hypothetical protein ABW20_dc0100173 [Dactylellina cionopaga]|nr:hypothetical protein ABW20_dc0100173 [Dactylellina cionopaga]